MNPVTTLAIVGMIVALLASFFYSKWQQERQRASGWLEGVEWQKKAARRGRDAQGRFNGM